MNKKLRELKRLVKELKEEFIGEMERIDVLSKCFLIQIDFINEVIAELQREAGDVDNDIGENDESI